MVKSPNDLENIPGVNAFIYSKLREHVINLLMLDRHLTSEVLIGITILL